MVISVFSPGTKVEDGDWESLLYLGLCKTATLNEASGFFIWSPS